MNATTPLAQAERTHLQALVADAHIPTLLAALSWLTGDRSLLQSEEEAAHEAALDGLVRWTRGHRRPEPAAEGELQSLMEFAVGADDLGPYVPLLREELQLDASDARAPDWVQDSIAPRRTLSCAVIGAGMSGILAGYRLGQAGIGYVILEKNDDLGGTWLENSYPGCRVDVPSHLYSYSFFQRNDWEHIYSTRDTLLDYFRTAADRFDVRAHIRFGTEVTAATFDAESARWRLELRTPTGGQELTVDVVVSAVGQLNRPQLPDIPGCDRFRGPAFHSAGFRHDVPLAGRRVALIGTGASAVQLLGPLAEAARTVTVFQRTPAWIIPTPDYHAPEAAARRWLFEHVPGYSHWYRFWLFWTMGDAMLRDAQVDPGWAGDGRSVSARNDRLRRSLTDHLAGEFADRPDLLAALVPQYPPAAKRMIRDNGNWARAMRRDNVSLVTAGIDRIEEDAVVTLDGASHEVDVIVYATGFRASEFLLPMTVTGPDGSRLHERWGPDARAHLGATIPGFPNLFLIYGPNTNLVVNGSAVFLSECSVRYVLGCIRLLLERGARTIECRADAHARSNERVDRGNDAMAWGASPVNSWYKSPTGRVSQNWPFSLLEFWQATLRPAVDDFTLST